MTPRTLAMIGLGLLTLAGCPRADTRQDRRDDRQDTREERRDDRQERRDTD
ncbi:MAG: hypothetical protein IPK07_28535 [Deltaproteobacteria bacterium]|nr:hypothetical protein [Deltaproteobacteria bacterium]